MTIKIDDIETLCEEFLAGGWRTLNVVSEDFELTLATDASVLASCRVYTDEASDSDVQEPGCRGIRDTLDTQTQNICADRLGTFHLAEEIKITPEQAFDIAPETVLGVIEVLGDFFDVSCGVTGLLQSILVDDGDLVEFGQPLATITSSGKAGQ